LNDSNLLQLYVGGGVAEFIDTNSMHTYYSEAYLTCSKEDDCSHILGCEGSNIWRGQVLDKGCRNINSKTSIRGTVGCKNKEQWQKI
jgi:hypothetical protein